MPFYEYLCQACGQHHEALQKMSDAPLKKCPHCGKPRLKRLVSAPVFRLKGGGWYETDFKSDKEAKRNLHGEEAKADKAEGAETKAAAGPVTTETKTDTKAEAKAETKAETRPAAKAAAKKAPSGTRKPARKGRGRR